MGEVSAQSLESPPSDKIAAKLGSVASEMLDVRDVHGIRLRSVSSRDSLNIRKPSSQETSKIIAAISGLPIESKPMNHNSSENAAGSKDREESGSPRWHNWV